jgi:hypothetical protein
MESPTPSIDVPFAPSSSPTEVDSKRFAAADRSPAFPAMDFIPPNSFDFISAERNAVSDDATDEDGLGFAPYVEAVTALAVERQAEKKIHGSESKRLVRRDK